MRIQRWLLTLTAINLAILIFLSISRMGSALAESAAPAVVRARAFQLVDEQGRVRASLSVLPAQVTHGERSAETVLLRLITERGRPSVKISASEESAGVTVVGPTGTSNTYSILEAKGSASSLVLKDEDGRQASLTPQ